MPSRAFPEPFLDPMPLDTQILLLKQALETERLLAEAEMIVIRNACFEATEAAALDKLD